MAEVERLLTPPSGHHVDGFVSLDETISRLCHLVLGAMDCAYSCVRLPSPTAGLWIRGGDVTAAHDEFLDLPAKYLAETGRGANRRASSVPHRRLQILAGWTTRLAAAAAEAHELDHRWWPLLPGSGQGVSTAIGRSGSSRASPLLTLQVVGRLIA